MKKIFLFTILLTFGILITGCAQKRKLYATYVMPPKAFSTIENTKNLQIKINKISVNGINKKAKTDIANYIKGRLASYISRNQYINIVDDTTNINKLRKLSKIVNHAHGYSSFSTAKYNLAKLNIDVNFNITTKDGIKIIELPLQTVYYGVKYSKGKYPAPYEVVQSVKTHKKIYKVPYKKYHITANMKVYITDNKHQKIYQRNFNNLELNQTIGGDNDKADGYMTLLDIASKLFDQKLKAIMQDISPYKKTLPLTVNENGYKKAVVLMKATAFSEAYRELSKYIYDKEQELAKKVKKINSKYQEEKQKIINSKEKNKKELLANLEKDKIKEINNLYIELVPDYENLAKINEIIGNLLEAKQLYELALKYDPANESIKKEYNDITMLLNKTKKLQNMKIKAKNQYKTKEYKER